MQNLTLKDVEDFYARFLTRRGSRLAVVGDVSQDEIVEKLSFLSKLPDREVKIPNLAAAVAAAWAMMEGCSRIVGQLKAMIRRNCRVAWAMPPMMLHIKGFCPCCSTQG